MKKLLLAFVLISSVRVAWAVGSGGYSVQAVGSKASGMGNAFTAVADDSSAVYFNPAGLTQLPSPQLSLGLAPVFPATKYTGDTPPNDEMLSYTAVVPNFYFTAPFKEKFSFGFGMNSPYGLETHWSNDGPLRYIATDSKLQFVQFNPVLAYKLNDQFSLAAGVAYARVDASLSSRVNMTGLNTVLNGGALTPSPDGNRKVTGDGDGWGYNAGVLYQPVEKHSFGMSYRSEIKTELSGQTKISDLSNVGAFVFGGTNYQVDTKTTLIFPQSLFLGYAYKPGKWTFSLDGEWVGYSSVKETKLEYSESDATRSAVLQTDNPIRRDWQSTWNLGLGTNYKFNDTWQARGGYMYYPIVVPDDTWDPSIPDSIIDGLTMGGSFFRTLFSVDLSYTYYNYRERTIHNQVGASSGTPINGKFKTNAQIVSANLNFKFGGKE